MTLLSKADERNWTDKLGDSFRRLTSRRALRLGSGLILLLFVASHLINHALGIFGMGLLNAGQEWRWFVWKSLPGTIALYGAFIVHIALTLFRIMRRRTMRMPLKEGLQLALGLAIPFMLIGHIAGTRLIGDLFGVDESYPAVLLRLWPNYAVLQSALVLVVWVHGMVGLDYWLKANRLHRSFVDDMLWAVAVLVPFLAIAGFVVSGREAVARYDNAVVLDREVMAFQANVVFYGRLGASGLLGVVGGVLAYREWGRRRRRREIAVNYVGHGSVMATAGPSLLEISRNHRIPHPSICGGRGRCATCRVLIVRGGKELPAMGVAEKALLEQIAAPPGVRLACQVYPTNDVSAQILLPVVGEKVLATQSEHVGWGLAETVTVLVVDMRAFTTLVNKQVPHELVVLLNRYQEEMIQAVKAHGGHVDLVVVDGLTAIFKRGGRSDSSSRDALKAARDMFKAIEALNQQYQGALPLPLRIGVGVHTGPVVTAKVGTAQSQAVTLALGETVAVASRLEAVTKEILSDLVVSRDVAEAAGLAIIQSKIRDIYVLGRDEPISAYPVSDLREIDQLM